MLDRRPPDRAPSHLVRRAREGLGVTPEEERKAAAEAAAEAAKAEEERRQRRRRLLTILLPTAAVLIIGGAYIGLTGNRGPVDDSGQTAGTVTASPETTKAPIKDESVFQFLQAQEWTTEDDWSTFQTLLGDVNGDGRADLIWNQTQETNRIYVALAQADGTFELQPAQEREERRWGGFKTLLGDINGDGRSDLIWNETQETNRLYVALGQQDGTFEFFPAQDRTERSWYGFETYIGDVNGDGHSDIIWNEPQEVNRVYVGLSNGDGTFEFLPAQDHPETSWQGYLLLIGDIDGDGRSDLVWNALGEANRIFLGLAQEDGTFNFLPGQAHPKQDWTYYQTLLGDINGDGRSDLIWNATLDVNRLYVGLAQQDGTFNFLAAQDHDQRGWQGFQTLTGDVNGDGRSDLIWNEIQETNRVYVALSRKAGTFNFLPGQDHTDQGWESFQTLVGDVNGDGRSDVVWNMITGINMVYVGLVQVED